MTKNVGTIDRVVRIVIGLAPHRLGCGHSQLAGRHRHSPAVHRGHRLVSGLSALRHQNLQDQVTQ